MIIQQDKSAKEESKGNQIIPIDLMDFLRDYNFSEDIGFEILPSDLTEENADDEAIKFYYDQINNKILMENKIQK